MVFIAKLKINPNYDHFPFMYSRPSSRTSFSNFNETLNVKNTRHEFFILFNLQLQCKIKKKVATTASQFFLGRFTFTKPQWNFSPNFRYHEIDFIRITFHCQLRISFSNNFSISISFTPIEPSWIFSVAQIGNLFRNDKTINKWFARFWLTS